MSTMTRACSIQLSHESRIYSSHGCSSNSSSMIGKGRVHLINSKFSSNALRHDAWNLHLLTSIHGPMRPVPSSCNIFVCRSVLTPGGGSEIPVIKSAAMVLTRSCSALRGSPVVLKLVPAVGIIAFAAWGLGPLLRLGRIVFLHKSDNCWNKSSTQYVMSSYLQPLLLWTGAMLICRALDPVVLPSEANQAVKQRLLNFMQSLSTVLAFAYCFSSLIQQAQQFFAEKTDSSGDARNMGFSFAAKAIYSAVWIAAVSLFMELLGFSTQRWLTAGGLGTVLLTLAGREIFTNFLSSVMIHATRPFVVNEWIQTKIEGYEVSGTVEHVGWWSPTIIRGDDREAVHIPNHKFTVNVVRNLTQKTHWRIKTHLAISHLDVNKINNIVADMRKVLAKNPQVEQQRLHRRVFLDNIDPETQALKILVSCFVKTSHFEEYLRVKEVILLDLLRVASHHRARLATPIRTVQKFYNGADLENVPFADSIFASSSAAANRPLLLIEPSYKINGEEKVKPSNHSASSSDEKYVKAEAASSSEPQTEAVPRPAPSVDTKSDSKTSVEVPTIASSKSELGNSTTNSQKSSESQQPDEDVEDFWRESPEPNSAEISLAGTTPEKSTVAKHDMNTARGDTTTSIPLAKQDTEKTPAQPSSPARPPLEENIILGVALEGSKLTLPIEDEMDSSPFPVESKEFASSRSGISSTGNEKKDGQTPTVPNSSQSN